MRAVVVPVKRFSCANERLCGFLSPSERVELARVMLGDVLSNLSRTSGADAFFMVTAEPEAAEMGRACGMEIITEKIQTGESSSVDFAMGKCREAGARTVLVVPGDIPAAQSEEFDAVMEKDDGRKRVVIVPSRDGTGTNAIMMSPCGIMNTSFGEGSFFRHKKNALGLGLEFSSIILGGIGLDIDAPEDIETFMSGGGTTATHGYLNSIGICSKTGKSVVHG